MEEVSSDRLLGSADVPRVVGRLGLAPGDILSLGFHGIGRRRRFACRGIGRTLRLRTREDAAGTAPGVTRLHYRLPARDWRGAAHPSTQRAAAAAPRRAPPARRPRLCRIDSFTYYTIIHRTGTTTTTTAPPRERAARGRAPPPAAPHRAARLRRRRRRRAAAPCPASTRAQPNTHPHIPIYIQTIYQLTKTRSYLQKQFLFQRP